MFIAATDEDNAREKALEKFSGILEHVGIKGIEELNIPGYNVRLERIVDK